MDISSSEFINALKEFRDDVIHHAEHEEAEEFSKLSSELAADDLDRMAGAVRVRTGIVGAR